MNPLFKQIQDVIISMLQGQVSNEDFIEGILKTVEEKVYKGDVTAATTLEVIAKTLARDKGVTRIVLTIEAQKTVEALIQATEYRWATDVRAKDLPGLAVRAIAEISQKHNIPEGKKYIKTLFENKNDLRYTKDPHFHQSVKTAHSILFGS